MGQKYIGPNFEDLDLPDDLVERIRSTAQVSETETESLGVSIESKTYPTKALADAFWRFRNYSEVYQFRLGMLWEAYFRNGNTMCEFWIRGHKNQKEMAMIEEALGLQVVKRPVGFDKTADVRKDGRPLKIISLSSSQGSTINSKFEYRTPRIYFGDRTPRIYFGRR